MADCYGTLHLQKCLWLTRLFEAIGRVVLIIAVISRRKYMWQ